MDPISTTALVVSIISVLLHGFSFKSHFISKCGCCDYRGEIDEIPNNNIVSETVPTLPIVPIVPIVPTLPIIPTIPIVPTVEIIPTIPIVEIKK
jgi:hypothetical protein